MANKFTYDTTNKLFILNSGVTSLNMKTEFYSWVKSDWKTNATLGKFKFPILGIAGQTIDSVSGQTIQPYYQLLYGWKLRPQEANHLLTIVGNVITDDGSDPFVNTVGTYNVRIKFVVPGSAISLNNADITDIKDISLGKWSINKTTNVMTMYKADGATILKQFTLNDNASVSERVPV